MDISPKQLVGKPKKVGKREGHDVLELTTKGGLSMIVAQKDKGFETLGAGPHRAVARFIAQKKSPGIQWTDLHKGDYVEPEMFQQILPKYERLTERLRSLHQD